MVIPAPRGRILDRNGIALVENREVIVVAGSNYAMNGGSGGDGNLAVMGETDGLCYCGARVRPRDLVDGSLAYTCEKHTDWITAAAFSPDGVLLATGDRANGLVLWEAQTGNEYLVLNGHTGSITDVAWRPDSNSLASASLDGTVRL